MVWYSGQTALFLFPLAKAALAYLPTALSVALRLLFPFRQAQYVQVSLLKPAPFCKLFAGLGSTNKSVISLFFSSYLTLVLSSPPCPLLHLSFYLKLSGRSGKNCLLSSSVLSGYNGSPDTRFSPGTMRLMSWPGWERYSCPLQSLVVSLLLSLASTLVFSRTGGVLSHRIVRHTGFLNFHRGTCAPSSRSLCSVSPTLQRTQPSFRFLSLYDWQNRESFLQRLQTLVLGHLSSHSALSRYGLFAPLPLWRLSVSLRPLVQALGSCPASGAPWSSAMPPSLGRGRVTTTKTTTFYGTFCSIGSNHFRRHYFLSAVCWLDVVFFYLKFSLQSRRSSISSTFSLSGSWKLWKQRGLPLDQQSLVSWEDDECGWLFSNCTLA